jgi:regulator of sigma E protease
MTIIYFILAALALGILVFFHELGHYFVAKKTGMVVEVFSIGFGKPLLKWRWNQVDWQLCCLPFGGYVKIAGMEFGKKDKYTYKEPYEIPNGFFSKSPIKRILVACAGPFANFILAFILFTAIWGVGGREKPFTDFTHIVGWVDSQSELFAQGLRPGDIITEYNGKPYTSSKDLLYAAMLGSKEIRLKGYHVDYASGERKPFNYTVEAYSAPNAIDGILTTGMTAGASYLIYDQLSDGSPNPLSEGSPLQGSGIAYQDRVVWADGEYLFSMDQLSHILNSSKAFLTVQRGQDIFFTRQPRVVTNDLIVPPHVRNELIDWQYEMQASPSLRKRTQDLYIIPFVVNNEGYVEAPLEFIDRESKQNAFPLHPYSATLDSPLLAGDQILAVDGVRVDKGYQILELLQQHRVHLIVEKRVPASTKVSWKHEDKTFIQDISYREIEKIAQGIGTPDLAVTVGRFELLKPVEPKPIDQFFLTPETQERLKEDFERQREGIEKIRDKGKRAQALKILEQSQHKLILGVVLQDRHVNYNPPPWMMFGTIFTETGQTLKALVTGYLNPKWISGPIGIVQVLHHGWKVGIGEALFWIAAISVNLGVLNLLPIPVLDGGYICLSLWEIITRRRLKAKTMERLIIPFVVLLIGLLVFLTFQDITRLF